MSFPCSVKAEFVFTFTFSLFVLLQCFPSPFPVTPTEHTAGNFSKEENLNPKKCKIINSSNIVQIFLSGIGLFTLLGLLYLNLCNRVRYVAFNTSFNLLSKKIPIPESYQSVLSYYSIIMLGLFLSESEKEQILLNIMLAIKYYVCD